MTRWITSQLAAREVRSSSHCKIVEEAKADLKMKKPTVLITGASSGIGATYADRFARRGHDLILVARDRLRMEGIAEQLRRNTGVAIDILSADLTLSDDVSAIEARLRHDASIGVLVNNAGAALSGAFETQPTEAVAGLVALNTLALARLTSAIAPRLVAAGEGAIVNIGSVVGLAPEFGMSVYGATKAFVLFLSQSLALELGPKGIYVQAVLPSATRTEIWSRAGMTDVDLSGMMDVGEMVDAALRGFDRREVVSIPPLEDETLWNAFDFARQAMLPGFRQGQPASRYRTNA